MRMSSRLFLLVLWGVLLSACGGGGGGGGNGGGNSSVASSASSVSSSSSVQPQTFLLGTQVTGSGSISPTSAQVTAGNTQSFTLTPAEGFELASTGGCAGSLNGSVFTTAAITAACTLTASFTPIEFSLSGTVTGLSGSIILALQVNAEQELLTISSNGGFAFQRSLLHGQGYQVAISTQPQGQSCQLTNEFGLVAGSNITNLAVACVALNATASVSGKITAVAGIVVDSTINDRFAPFVDNSSPLQPQAINNRVTLHGFASQDATGGNSVEERYADEPNEDDYYLASLQAGQIIQLQVVDFAGFDVGSQYQGDLDLYLFDLQGDRIAFSNSVTEFEEVVVPTDGDYLVNVWAFSGTSKYVLRLLPPAAENLQVGTHAEFVPHEMIVQLDKTVDSAQMKAQMGDLVAFRHQDKSRPTLVQMQPQVLSLSASGKQKTKAYSSRGLEDLRQVNAKLYDQLVTLRNIKAMRMQPGVSYVEPNYIRRTLRDPNDPGYPSQWHYNAISLPQAWDISVGARPVGQEVLVAVLDTGVYLAHPDLTSQLTAGYDFIGNPQSAGDGDGIETDADDPGDSDQRGQSSWHGTHVAGTIAASSNNNSGVAGVAWGARIMPIRVLGLNGGTSYDVIQGLRYAARLSNDSGTLPARRADIANLSLGGGGGSLAEQNAYTAARATGMIIVAAAGNDNTSSPSYPAAYDGVISVSATDFANQRAPYSNFGSSIDLAAPGGDVTVDLNGDGYADGVLSALADDTSGNRQPTYGFYHGTSMAAPHVAGVLALMKAVYPNLTPDQVDSLIQAGSLSDDLGVAGRDNSYGYGLINALKAVRAAADLAAGAPLPEWPAQVRASPASLNLGLAVSASLSLANQGGGDPQITSATANRPWLSVSPVTVSAKGLGSYQVSINRTGLDAGYYQGQINFAVSGADPVAVVVNMQVGSVSSDGELTQLYVLLLDQTLTGVQQVTPTRSGKELLYSFNNVPAGDYTVIAGSDIDVDLIICQSGESCGAYPSLAQRQVISVQGVNLTGVDFVADILGNFSTLGANSAETPTAEPGFPRRPIELVSDGQGVKRD